MAPSPISALALAAGAAATLAALLSHRRRMSRYSLADQVARFARAQAASNTRYLKIDSLYDGRFLSGKRVLLTGGSRGLGLSTVSQMVRDGAIVTVVGRSTSRALEHAQPAKIVQGVDVCDTEAVMKMANEAEAPFDIVINNAGYFTEKHESFKDGLDFEEQLKQIDICALG